MRAAGGLPNRALPRRAGPLVPRPAAVALLLALAACADEESRSAPAYDLGENLAFARITRETDAVTLGTPGDESHLLSGWGHPEREPRSGHTFRWGLEPHSELVFEVLEPRPVTLELDGRPRRGTGGAPPAVEVELDGRPAGRLELEPVRRSYTLELSPAQLRRGANRLRLRYRLSDRPALPPEEERALGVAWYRIGFAGLRRPAAEPRVDRERGLLFLPYGSRADFYLRAPAGAVLRSARRRFVAGDGLLTVDLGRDGAGDQRLAALDGEGELAVPLPAAGGEPVRLSLAAVSSAAAGPDAGIALAAPAVWTDAPPRPAPPATPAATGSGARPNMIIYLVDTLRADRLGCYGHRRDVSPRLDRFAAGATLFENARAQAPWTLPAVASLMTGLWPPAHGVIEGDRRLAPEVVTLAEVLRDAGYQTAALVTNGFATAAYGLDQGFDQLTLIESPERRSREVHQAAVDWLATRDPERPFFLYLHTLDPHQPYLPADEHRQRWAAGAEEIWRQIVDNPSRMHWPPEASVIEQLLALYDAEVAENDASFGDILDALAAAGLYDDAVIVFLSDHGEQFYEHQAWTHGGDLFPEALNVPLVVKLPGQRQGRRVAALAQQIDLMPTLLALLGLEGPATGGRLLPALLESGEPGDSPGGRVFSHTRRDGQTTASVIEDGWKYIRRVDARGVRQLLVNWHDDPGELTDRAADHPILVTLLDITLQRHLAGSVPPQAVKADPDERVLANLRALGYVD